MTQHHGCTIYFDHSQSTYSPGQNVNGYAECEFLVPRRVSGVKMKFVGEAKTYWTKTESKRDNEGKTYDETIEFSGYQEYFRVESYIWGGQYGEAQLPAGKHNFPFNLLLPSSIPSSLEGGDYGYIRYSVTIQFINYNGQVEDEYSSNLKVVRPLDLNTMPNVDKSRDCEFEKRFCCWCCQSNPIYVHLRFPHNGYVPGQKIEFEGECNNGSSKDVDDIKINFEKSIVFKTQSPSVEEKHQTTKLKTYSTGPVPAGESKNLKFDITIPTDIQPSTMSTCAIIEVKYFVEIYLSLPTFAFDENKSYQVTIGTVPLESTLKEGNFPPAPSTDAVVQPNIAHPPVDVGFQNNPPPYPSQYPPTSQNIPYPQPTPSPYPPAGNPYPPSTGSPYPNLGGSNYPPTGSPYPPQTGGYPPINPYPAQPSAPGFNP